MEDAPLLTIIVPTYNRYQYLIKLLLQLEKELVGINKLVTVFIGDNHSIDRTPILIQEFLERHPEWQTMRHPENIGADRNFLACIDYLKSRYFWIIGDDDLPRTGLILLIIKFLQKSQPTLIYLASKWSPVVSNDDLPSIQSIHPKKYSALEYAQKINVFTTYISAWIIDSYSLSKIGFNTEKFAEGIDTSFIQLGWILPLIKDEFSLIEIEETCIFATSGNTGGYELLKTFGINYPKFVYRLFPNQPKMQKALIAPFAREYFPNLIQSYKSGAFQKMKYEDNSMLMMIKYLGFYKEFWLYTFPALILPPQVNNARINIHHFGPKLARKMTKNLIPRQLVRSIYNKIADRIAVKVINLLQVSQNDLIRNRLVAELGKLKKVGENIDFPEDFDLRGHEYISLGSNFIAERGLRLHCWKNETLEKIPFPSLQIGDRVFFNREAYVSCARSIKIGDDTLFGSNILITDNYHGSTRHCDLSRYHSPLSCPGDVEIEQGAWVGNNVCILPGSHIGKGCIVGANSVVNSHLPDFSIAVGAPARVVASLLPTKDSI